jgi:hypothetical protein
VSRSTNSRPSRSSGSVTLGLPPVTNVSRGSRSAAAFFPSSATWTGRTLVTRPGARTRSVTLRAGPPDSVRRTRGEPDQLVKELAEDEAIAAADTLLLTIPNQLGVDYNAHILDSVLRYLAPDLGWR